MFKVEIQPFHEKHLFPMFGQKDNPNLETWVASGVTKKIHGDTFFINGEPMVCAGVIELWPNRASVWCVVNENVRHHYVTVIRAMTEWLDLQPFDRIEIHVEEKYPDAVRRALLLGFKMETEKAVKYLPNGATCSLLARIKE